MPLFDTRTPRSALEPALEAAAAALEEILAIRAEFTRDIETLRSRREELHARIDHATRAARQALEDASAQASSALAQLATTLEAAGPAAASFPSRTTDPSSRVDPDRTRLERECLEAKTALQEISRTLDREREAHRRQAEESADMARRLALQEARLKDLEAQSRAKDRTIEDLIRATRGPVPGGTDG